ncbi:unnamed protein product [Acanthoscelides obtectus]|uniref:Zinc metalloproteinase n=1 Tax=Acanthoscelides obtectus TaxID=200917 RepID=A0A9P0LSX7_ACAOB|nr:unnamed protein product [Acanthoscelides obtectus]CAK1621360.1 Putative zinc metalloproteinase YIL108W [Acanthoscelides obtectus]
MSNHNLKIVNFQDSDVVSYSIIKILGNIEEPFCQKGISENVSLTLNDKKYSANISNKIFKFLIELHNGKNEIQIHYCCDTIQLDINYVPKELPNTVIPLYVICEGHSGCFQAPANERNNPESACKRIMLCLKLLQCVTAEKLNEHDLGRKTFQIQENCRIFKSSIDYLKAQEMNQMELWQNIGKDIISSFSGSKNKKYLAFLSCTHYCGEQYVDGMKTHEELLGITKGYVALGGGNLALFGTACLFTWPEHFDDVISRFEDDTPIDRTQFLDDSCYRGTVGSCFSTTLGSVLHELYHTFDLGHSKDGIMGRGFDNICKVFTNPQICKSSSFHNKIEFKEQLSTCSLKHVDKNMKKDFTVIRRTEEVDDTLLTKSCAVLLSFHRYKFNSFYCAVLAPCFNIIIP